MVTVGVFVGVLVGVTGVLVGVGEAQMVPRFVEPLLFRT